MSDPHQLASTWEGVQAARFAPAGRHQLQHDLIFSIAQSRGLRGGGGEADLALRGTHPRLVKANSDEELHGRKRFRRGQRTRSTPTTRIRLTREFMGARSATAGRPSSSAACDLPTISRTWASCKTGRSRCPNNQRGPTPPRRTSKVGIDEEASAGGLNEDARGHRKSGPRHPQGAPDDMGQRSGSSGDRG